jgi:arsenate reductase (thioredoxin)
VPDKPAVLFVCVHNAGRSQMAAAFLDHLSQGAVEVRSAGSEPAEQVNAAAVAAMAEVGIDLTTAKPKILTTDAVKASDVVITMGCGDTCPFYPGKRYEDWVLKNQPAKESTPYGQSETQSGAESKISSANWVPTSA